MWQLLTVAILGCSLLALHIQYSFRNHCPTANPWSPNWILCKQLFLSWPAFHYYFQWVIKKAFRVRQRWWGSSPVLPHLPPPTSQKNTVLNVHSNHFQPGQPLPASRTGPWTEQPRTAEQRLLRSKRELGRTPDGGVRAEQQPRQHTTIANKTLPMNIHGLQSKMGLVPDRSRKTNKNCKTTHATPQHTKPTENNPTPTNQQPTQKSVPDPIYKWE